MPDLREKRSTQQYVHRNCQVRWERHHNTCGLCREVLSGCNDRPPTPIQTNRPADDDDDAAANAARTEILNNRPRLDTDRIANDVLNMTQDEVIARLRELIDSPSLEQELERVRKNQFVILIRYLDPTVDDNFIN